MHYWNTKDNQSNIPNSLTCTSSQIKEYLEKLKIARNIYINFTLMEKSQGGHVRSITDTEKQRHIVH